MFDVYEMIFNEDQAVRERAVVVSGAALPEHLYPNNWRWLATRAKAATDIAEEVRVRGYGAYSSNAPTEDQDTIGHP